MSQVIGSKTTQKKTIPFSGTPGVGILGAVGREGRNSRLSHYHETSGLAQMREELVHTTQYIYEILHCHTETREPHRKALAPNIQILNMCHLVNDSEGY